MNPPEVAQKQAYVPSTAWMSRLPMPAAAPMSFGPEAGPSAPPVPGPSGATHTPARSYPTPPVTGPAQYLDMSGTGKYMDLPWKKRGNSYGS